MGKLEKYSSYKDSGVEWLGEIPKGWEVKKIKFVSLITMGQSPENKDVNQNKTGLPFLQGNAEFGSLNPTEKNWCIHPKKVAFKDEILYSVRAPVGAVNIADKEYCIGRGLCSIRDIKIQKKYLYYSSILFKQEFDKFSTGSTFEAISTFNIKNIKIPLPLPLEQTKIASFLDEKTAQIDEVISQKQKLIELLKERKQIVINDAVTKGLDKDVEMMDSGVEWIGKIPKHWEILPLKACTKLKSIKNVPDLELLSVYLDLGVIRFKDVEQKRTNVTSIDLSDYQLVEEGDFVLNNQQAWRGSVGVSKYKGIISPAYIVLELSDKFNFIFANYYFRNKLTVSQYLINSKGVGTIQRNLYWGSLKQTYISIPSKDEQFQIIEYIENQTTKIDKAIVLQQNYISKLKEYKASLIDSVVTGKVRVF